MKEQELLKDLSIVINRNSIDSSLNLSDYVIAEYLLDSIKSLSKLNNAKDDASIEDSFIERMYALYPTKCPKRGTTLGKSRKDKDRIRKLLKQYSMEEIETVFKREIEEKYEKHYMQNFSTFLNNFPDPNVMFSDSKEGKQMTKEDKLIINGQFYR